MTILYLTWESPYLVKTVFILRQGPVHYISLGRKLVALYSSTVFLYSYFAGDGHIHYHWSFRWQKIRDILYKESVFPSKGFGDDCHLPAGMVMWHVWMTDLDVRLAISGSWYNIEKSSYQYREFHCGDTTALISSYFYNRCNMAFNEPMHCNKPNITYLSLQWDFLYW